jgi:hypothetical protein
VPLFVILVPDLPVNLQFYFSNRVQLSLTCAKVLL